jgi:hypothetical protein
MATIFKDACTALAPYVDNGVNATASERIASRVNEAQRRLIDQYNFLCRREDLERPEKVYIALAADSTEPLIIDAVDATKAMILAMWREENNELEQAQTLETKAIGMLERDLVQEVETERRIEYRALEAASGQNTLGGLIGRLGLETFEKYRNPKTRCRSYINQAYQAAIDHHNYLIRRETLGAGCVLELVYTRLVNDAESFNPLIPIEVIRQLAVSLMMQNAGAPVADVTAVKGDALAIIERNVTKAVEADRKAIFQTLAEPGNQGTFAGLVGRLGLEAATQYSLSPERVASYVNQGTQIAIDHYNSVVRREDKELPELVWSPVLSYRTAAPLEPLIPAEVIRLIVLSLLMQNAGADGAPVETQALAIIERNVTKAVERLRKETTGEVGRMHNEIANGLTIPTARMRTFVNQATTEIVAHQDFLQRTDDDDTPPPPATFEQKRLLVESYIAALAGQMDVATATKKLALELIERDSTANDQTMRRKIRSELAQSSPSSYGYCWGRIGLGFTGALEFSNEAIKRAVTGAEESLMNSGKWVGTVADFAFTIDHSQLVYLPREVETVLFATFDGDPRPVHDRFAEYMRGGAGIKSEEAPYRSGFQDRGEGVEAEGGPLKRKYFVSVPKEGTETLVRYIAKIRFVPHFSDTDSMFLRNQEAMQQAAVAILTEGKLGQFDAATKLLSAQVYQQYFKSQVGGVHNKPVRSMR